MKAAVFHGPNQPLTIEELDLDKPKAREIVVRTVASGVCHSDLHFVEGLWPFPAPAVLGHETAGIVEEVGELVSSVQPGDHVIGCLSAFCGTCEQCLRGRPYLCRSPETQRPPTEPKLKLAGTDTAVNQFANISSFAERMLLHENAAVKIREDMPLDRAALIGCAIVTGVGAALRTAAVEPGSTTAVFGAGGVGLAVIQGCYIAGARQIIAVDVVESKLGLAKELGATHLVDASAGDPVQRIRELSGGGVDYSFEAIGLKAVAEQAVTCLKPGGTATIIGMIPIAEKVEIGAMDLFGEKRLQGCNMGSNRFPVDMPRYVDFYLQGRLRLDEMITKRAKLEDVNEAFRAMKAGEVARTVIVFE